MTTVTAAANFYPRGFWKSAQPGVSDTAARIRAILHSSLADTLASATGQARIAEPIGRLDDLFSECHTANWDGEGAEPVSSAAYMEARTLLLLLPSMIQIPEFVPERSGRIAFEWYLNSEHVYLLSISGTGELEFAGIFGRGNEIHGRCNFSGSLPEMVAQHLSMLFSSHAF
jgi:hypothetical protein